MLLRRYSLIDFAAAMLKSASATLLILPLMLLRHFADDTHGDSVFCRHATAASLFYHILRVIHRRSPRLPLPCFSTIFAMLMLPQALLIVDAFALRYATFITLIR